MIKENFQFISSHMHTYCNSLLIYSAKGKEAINIYVDKFFWYLKCNLNDYAINPDTNCSNRIKGSNILLCIKLRWYHFVLLIQWFIFIIQIIDIVAQKDNVQKQNISHTINIWRDSKKEDTYKVYCCFRIIEYSSSKRNHSNKSFTHKKMLNNYKDLKVE